jgi:hypothetical protein
VAFSSVKWVSIAAVACASSVGLLPTQLYGAVSATSHSEGASRWPLKSGRGPFGIGWVMTPSGALTPPPVTWHDAQVSPVLATLVSRKSRSPIASSSAFGVEELAASAASRMRSSSALAILAPCGSMIAASELSSPDSAVTPRATPASAAIAASPISSRFLMTPSS